MIRSKLVSLSVLSVVLLYTAISPANYPSQPASRSLGRYVEIPIVGDIGFDVTPSGFSDVLERSTRNFTEGRINVILLLIDSHGGSDVEAIQMANMLADVDSEIHVVAAVRQAIGPAMALVLASDEMVVLEPDEPGIRLQYQPALGRDMKADREAYREVTRLGPGASMAVDAMFDPEVSVYSWLDANGDRVAATTRPEGVELVAELPAGALADGLSAKELDQLGIGTQASNLSRVGAAIGYDSWTRVQDYSSLMRAAAQAQSTELNEVQERLDRAMSLTGQALELEASLVELEAAARGEDPRRQPYNYRSRYSRARGSWGYNGGRRGWGYGGPTTRSWRANSDQAVAAWGRVVNTIDQVFSLGGQAQADLDWLKSQQLPASMKDWVGQEIKILDRELNPLLAKESVLMNRRAAAESEATFFKENRSRPVM